jgi:hypothetical protein
MLGVYPVGTLVKLNTEEIGLVKENPEQSDGTKPLVVVLIPQDNGRYSLGDTIDLSDREVPEGTNRRRIAETYNPALFGIQPAEYIL